MTSPSIAVIAACPFPVNYCSPAAIRELCKTVWREKADVIHAHKYKGVLAGIFGKLVTRKPLIYHVRVVRRGLMADEMIEIIDGLQEGEEVVAVGQLDLRDNDRVNVNHSGPWNR